MPVLLPGWASTVSLGVPDYYDFTSSEDENMHVDSDQGTPWLKRCQARLLRKLLRSFVKSTDLNWRDIVQIARECEQIAENKHQCTGPHPAKVEKKLFSQTVEATRSLDADEHGRAY